ncbi:MAG: geranylgeranylglycerol-phosphate geranylgeranyltransferase [Candidatus Njordarchaeales archaeon]
MKLSTIPTLLRIHNAVFGALTVIISGLLFTKDLVVLGWGVVAYIALAAAGNVINDIYDIEVDKINKPHRPLPSGAISIKEAKIIYILLVITGLIAAAKSSHIIGNPLPLLIAIIFAGIGILYSAKLKLLGFIGNITVGCSFSIGYIYGWVITGMIVDLAKIITVLLFFIVSTTLLVAREIIKGIEDVKGDALRNVKTLARTRGIPFASKVAALFLLVAIISFTILPFIKVISWTFIPFMIVGDIAAFLSLVYALKGEEGAPKASFYAKIGAFVGLVGFLVGVIPVAGL